MINTHTAKQASAKEAQDNYLSKLVVIDASDLRLVEMIKQLQEKAAQQLSGEK